MECFRVFVASEGDMGTVEATLKRIKAAAAACLVSATWACNMFVRRARATHG